MIERIKGSMLYKFLRSAAFGIVFYLMKFKQMFCKRRSPVEHVKYDFYNHLRRHGIVTVLPSQSNEENPQIEYLNWNNEERIYFHRTVNTNIGLLHMVTGHNGEMKIITDWFYKQTMIRHTLETFNEIAKRCEEKIEEVRRGQEENSKILEQIRQRLEEFQLKIQQYTERQAEENRGLYNKIMELKRQFDEDKKQQPQSNGGEIKPHNDSYIGYI